MVCREDDCRIFLTFRSLPVSTDVFEMLNGIPFIFLHFWISKTILNRIIYLSIYNQFWITLDNFGIHVTGELLLASGSIISVMMSLWYKLPQTIMFPSPRFKVFVVLYLGSKHLLEGVLFIICFYSIEIWFISKYSSLKILEEFIYFCSNTKLVRIFFFGYC